MTISRYKDGEGAAQIQPVDYAAMKKFVTNQIIDRVQGSTLTARDIFMGAFPWLWIGTRSPLKLTISRDATDSDSGAFTHGQIWMKVTLRADAMSVRPKFFCNIKGII